MILMTQQEVIKAFMKSLDETSKTGEAALNEAIKACSPFKSFTALKAAMIKDCKNAKSGNDFLKTYCGIDYSTEDNGAITGSDAGGSTSKTDDSIVPESGSLKNFTGSSFKVNNLTVKLSGKTYSQLSTPAKFIWQGLYTWWVKNSLDLTVTATISVTAVILPRRPKLCTSIFFIKAVRLPLTLPPTLAARARLTKPL